MTEPRLMILATCEGVRPLKDGGWSVRFATQEPNQNQVSQMLGSYTHFGVLVFLPGQETMTDEELKALGEIDMDIYDKPKSINKRIMNTLWILWDQNNEGYEDFKDYYKAKKEKYLTHLKNQITQP